MLRTIGLLALVATATTACVSKKKYVELEDQYADLQSRHEALVDEHEAAMADHEVDIDRLEEQVAELSDENSELKAFYTRLIDEFRPAMERGDVVLLMQPDRTVLVFEESAHFATGSAKLSSGGQSAIRKLAGILKDHGGWRFEVEGHTDDRPIHNDWYASNWELGAARALSVVDVMLDAGVDGSRVSAATFADTQPWAPGDHAKNRRVQVSLAPTLADLPMHEELAEQAREANALVTPSGGSPVAAD